MVLRLTFLLLISCAVFVLGVGHVLAATQTIVASIAFDTVLTVSNTRGIDFGMVKAGQVGDYTISPTGAVVATNGGVRLNGASQAGSLTMSGSTTQTIDISAGNYVANNGVVPSKATCVYDNGPVSSCNLTGQIAPGAGKVLKVGVSVSVDGSQAVSTTAAPTFDIVVNYH